MLGRVEARLEQTEHGLKPTGEGWYVVNLADLEWLRHGTSAIASTGGEADFAQLGAGVDFLGPGRPMAAYHWETDQEDFLVLAGSGTVVLDGEEHPLRQWDVVHCPPGTAHVIVGGPMLVFAVGARERHTMLDESGRRTGRPDWGEYVADPVAAKHGAAPERTTSDGTEAYAGWERPKPARYDGWLDRFAT
jgi:mannose-6-phosphate isomerase-like protein (cupin superfamily)